MHPVVQHEGTHSGELGEEDQPDDPQGHGGDKQGEGSHGELIHGKSFPRYEAPGRALVELEAEDTDNAEHYAQSDDVSECRAHAICRP